MRVTSAAWHSASGSLTSAAAGLGSSGPTLLPTLQLKAVKPREAADMGAAACSLPNGTQCLWLPCKADLPAAGLSLQA